MNTYELFEAQKNYTEHFATANTIYLTVNSDNGMNAKQLDKFLKKYFTKVETNIFGEQRKHNMRSNRIERLVAIETQANRAHAHILVNADICDAELLLVRLKLTYLKLWNRNKANTFLFDAELLRSRIGSSKYNNKELLTEAEKEKFVALANASTFIKKKTQHRIRDIAEQKHRELLEERIGKEIDDEVWNKVIKKLRKQRHKEKNALRLKRKISNNKIISRRKKHKQKNFAIVATHSI